MISPALTAPPGGEGHWYAIASSRELRSKPRGFMRFGERLVLWRDAAGAPRALRNRCPHRGGQLSAGRIRDDTLECPFHGFRFDARGQCQEMPCEGGRSIPGNYRVDSFELRERDGWIWLWRGSMKSLEQPEQLPDPPHCDWQQGQPYGELRLQWSCHYTRALEVQIDYAHLPFVHRNTIGRVLEVPEVHVEAEAKPYGLHAHLTNHPKSADQAIRVLYPNVWLNHFPSGTLLQAMFAPVDETHTATYFRVHHRVRVPVLSTIVGFVMAQASRLVVQQDRPFVESQRPRSSDEAQGEKLTPADAAVMLYRRLRRTYQGARACRDLRPLEPAVVSIEPPHARQSTKRSKA